ncbi:MAG: SDR family NAD(P)-dependent oxidoreductase [Gemmatimonadales bacterium]
MDLSNKTVIVTGAASGIGKETVAELRRRGAMVIGVDRNPADEVDEFFHTDLADPDSIDRPIDELPFGANGLCNIAGLPPTQPADMVLKVNVLGLQRLTLAMVPKLADGASIVNLASMAGNQWREKLQRPGRLVYRDNPPHRAKQIAWYTSRQEVRDRGKSDREVNDPLSKHTPCVLLHCRPAGCARVDRQ